MKFRQRTLRELADMICGNTPADSFFEYRTSSKLTEFFWDCDTEYSHDGSTRSFWVANALGKILDEPQSGPNEPPAAFSRIISELMDPRDAVDEGPNRPSALKMLNGALEREGFEAFYASDAQCHLRHLSTNTVTTLPVMPRRALSPVELAKRSRLEAFLDTASEDSLIELVLIPLFRQLGFQRVTAAGHTDKALEYGKDVWMKFALPTEHILYFGIQAKRGKIDAAGVSKSGNANVAEILNQVAMMLGHAIFDPEIGKRRLVDHAFIVAGGEITKAARNWLGHNLDASRRSQILFMDRDDILNLYAVTNLPLPEDIAPEGDATGDNDIPF